MGCWANKTNPRAEPVAVRGCTDTFWLCVYVLFWCLMIIIAAFAFVYGNPLRLIHGYDSFGNTCGQMHNIQLSESSLSGMNTIQKPYLFYLDLLNFKTTLKVCVKQCPNRLMETPKDLFKFYKDTESNLCRYDFDLNVLNDESVFNSKTAEGSVHMGSIFNILGPCPTFPIYDSEPILHRCIPKPSAVTNKILGTAYSDALNSWGESEQLLGDLYTAWPYLLGCSILAFVLSLILISVLHILTSFISWLILILVAASCIAATGVLWSTYAQIKYDVATIPNFQLLSENIRNESAILTLAIIATVITVIILIIIWILKGKLGPLAALFKEAGSCLASVPSLMGPPLLASIILIGFLAFWVTVVVCLATANYPGVKPFFSANKNLSPTSNKMNISDKALNTIYKNNATYTLVEYVNADWLHYMWWFYLVGLIWTSEFILACLNMTIAGAVAHWYFRKSRAQSSPVTYSMSKLIKYHLGSVALGSLLITIFKIPRLILTYLYTKMKRHEDESDCASCCLRCGICCFWALEKFIRYLNHNAYTVIVIESINFCPAAVIAWNALMVNALQVATINGIGDFVLFLGKITVSALCGMVGLFLLRDHPDIHLYAIPVVVITVFSFLIAHCVLSLYEIIVDTLFLCVCEDRTINGENGRWKDSALAGLVSGGTTQTFPSAPGEPLELSPINKQIQS